VVAYLAAIVLPLPGYALQVALVAVIPLLLVGCNVVSPLLLAGRPIKAVSHA
jgi:hypothetical protein